MGYPDENSLKRVFSEVLMMLKHKYGIKEDLKEILKLIKDFKKKSYSQYRRCKLLKDIYIYSSIQQLLMITKPSLRDEFIVFVDQADAFLSDIRFEINQCKKLEKFIKNDNIINIEEIEELINLMKKISEERFNKRKDEEKLESKYNSEEYREQVEEKIKLIMKK